MIGCVLQQHSKNEVIWLCDNLPEANLLRNDWMVEITLYVSANYCYFKGMSIFYRIVGVGHAYHNFLLGYTCRITIILEQWKIEIVS